MVKTFVLALQSQISKLVPEELSINSNPSLMAVGVQNGKGGTCLSFVFAYYCFESLPYWSSSVPYLSL
jgi:hypothetical protein